MASTYELERAENIAANRRALDALGLLDGPLLGGSRKRKRERQPSLGSPPPAPPARPTRRSSRGAPAIVDNDTAAASPPPPAALRPWQLAVFEECERAMPAAPLSCTFDARRHHQHLERSASGRSIATTGVAGYGAAIVAKPAAGACAWDIEVVAVRFGVGGFGVGVVRGSMKPPYKSLGKSEEALGAYLANGNWAHAGAERPFGPAYAPGDRIGVCVRAGAKGAARELVFFLNGEEVGVVATLRGAEEVRLAVQPYMGGVALLNSFAGGTARRSAGSEHG
eukprot:1645874-Prymnesium_polylepis.1